jgi:hypothetical protein
MVADALTARHIPFVAQTSYVNPREVSVSGSVGERATHHWEFLQKLGAI